MKLEDELKKLISFKSVTSDLKACSALLKYQKNYFDEIGLKTEYGDFEGHPYLIVTNGLNLRNIDLLLQAHIDVVPAPPALFDVTKKDDKLFGRGTYDMLFAVACFNKLLLELTGTGDLNSMNIGVMLTSDEEIGGENGVGMLFEDYDCKVCVLPDAGSDKEICNEAKGVLQLKVTILGVAGHGARPWQTDSPILKLPEVVSRIKELFPNTDQEATTCSFTQVHSGEANNQVPSTASIVLDIRFEPADKVLDIKRKIEDCLQGIDITIEEADVIGDSYAINVNDPYVKSFKVAHKAVTGVELDTMRAAGSSDACYIAPKGIPIVMTRPLGGGMHGDDEWVSLSSLEQYYQVLKKYVLTFRKV